MRSITVNFEDGNKIHTSINGTNESIEAHYIGNSFDFGDTEEHPQSKMVKAVSVDFHDEVKHTPGPWTNKCHPDNNEDTATICNDKLVVAMSMSGSFPIGCRKGFEYPSEEVAVANAKLIAAAPDTLEKLDIAIVMLAALKNGNGFDENYFNSELKSMIAISDKAKGINKVS